MFDIRIGSLTIAIKPEKQDHGLKKLIYDLKHGKRA